ncbi:MAG: hypothetical protein R3C03_21535 [Pirellulaceae bacterium]
MKFRWTFVIVLGTFVAIIVAVVFYRPVKIGYHRYSLERIHDNIYGEPTAFANGLVGFGNASQIERLEMHCNQLAALGYFFHKKYEMEKLPKANGVHSALWRIVQSEFPDSRYPTLSYPSNVLEVWDLPECEGKWDEFVEPPQRAGFR